jgi:SAM-dependent methyltransferase
MKNTELWVQRRFFKNKKGRFTGPHMQRLIGPVYEQAIKEFCHGKLADLGCGDVPYYIFYKNLVSEITCVDWKNSMHNISYCDIETDLNNDLPLEDSYFDTVLASDVLEHIHEPKKFISEIARILKPEGYLILGVPFMYWIHENHDYHRYTKQMLEMFCKKNGLKVIRIDIYGGLPEILYDLMHKGYAYYGFKGRRIYYFFLESIGKFLSRRKWVRRLSNKSKDVFPLGYVLVAQK